MAAVVGTVQTELQAQLIQAAVAEAHREPMLAYTVQATVVVVS